MQDLAIIQRQNNEATLRDIPNQQKAGKHVVAEYTGLHFVGYTTHDTKDAADAKLAELNARGDSTHGKLYLPITA